MTGKEFLQFLHVAERLKSVTRHCYTADGTHEAVAGHCWRMTLMAMPLEPELPDTDMQRVIRMCIIHDLGEAVTGDIPSFLKTDADERVEANAIAGLLAMLPEPQRETFRGLFAEMNAMETPEARCYKALDRLEAVIQHNESDIATWTPREYELNRTYGAENAAEFPYLRALRTLLCEETDEKIKQGGIA